VFEKALEKKWLKNHINPKENAYESTICVYYKEADTVSHTDMAMASSLNI
jgi:hypothetical protein